jgi:hypothetical protein
VSDVKWIPNKVKVDRKIPNDTSMFSHIASCAEDG